MPRRPKNSSGKSKRSRPHKRSGQSLEKWNTLNDIPLDDEDQFHASRDKILLDGQTDEHSGDDEEVFALKGLEGGSEEELEEDDEDDGEAHDIESPKSKRPKSKDKKQVSKKRRRESSSSEEEEEEEESWGRNASAYYASNAAHIDSDDEEALQLEENEAMRLQAKARDGMDENDFGLNDPYDENTNMSGDLAEPAPVVLPSLPNNKKSLLRHLEKNSPEALALAMDWDDSVNSLMRTQAKLEQLQSANPDSPGLGMVHLYYQTLITYTTTLAFYLHLRASEKYSQRPEMLRAHPIMTRLLTLKQTLSTLEELNFAPTDSEDEFKLDEDGELSDVDLDELEIIKQLSGRLGQLEPHELSELLKDVLDYREEPIAGTPQANELKPPKKKRKISKDSSVPAQPIFDLVEPEFKPTTTSTAKPSTQDNVSDVYGEMLSLEHSDAADKSARRKSLRFHTAKIQSASARRHGARQALGGDDDIPYRERKKEKEARESKVGRDRVMGQGGADLDDTEPEPRLDVAQEDEDADPDGYYNLVKKQSKQRKVNKKADYEAMKAAQRQNLDEESEGGPRSLTKAILSNRGLTPHRPRSSRNPRVRKREKYDKAKKKVASQKAIYKGGLSGAGGHYDGEKSGISKIVKSVRLA
ncbi:hypothetical protein APHAL10511_002571 [Amanita phalloides]|nr:hypothetical protein APHAL10511_002571 [Amanita phalloides]